MHGVVADGGFGIEEDGQQADAVGARALGQRFAGEIGGGGEQVGEVDEGLAHRAGSRPADEEGHAVAAFPDIGLGPSTRCPDGQTPGCERRGHRGGIKSLAEAMSKAAPDSAAGSYRQLAAAMEGWIFAKSAEADRLVPLFSGRVDMSVPTISRVNLPDSLCLN